MREVDFCVLSSVSAYRPSGRTRMTDIVTMSGFCSAWTRLSCEKMVFYGMIVKHGWDYFITERGKIALAIETGRRTKSRECREYRQGATP